MRRAAVHGRAIEQEAQAEAEREARAENHQLLDARQGLVAGWRSRGGPRLWMSQALGRFGSDCSSAATMVWSRSLVMACPILWPLPWAVAALSLPAIRSARRRVESGRSMVGSKVRQPWAGCGGLGWIGPASVVAVPAARAGNASEPGRSADRSDRSHCPINWWRW